MPDLENSASPQVKLIYEWGQGFEKKDPSLIAKSLHKDYRHIAYPRSLGLPEKTKEEWLERLVEIMSLWTENEVSYISRYLDPLPAAESSPQPTMHSLIADIPGKVIVHVRIPRVQINTTPT